MRTRSESARETRVGAARVVVVLVLLACLPRDVLAGSARSVSISQSRVTSEGTETLTKTVTHSKGKNVKNAATASAGAKKTVDIWIENEATGDTQFLDKETAESKSSSKSVSDVDDGKIKNSVETEESATTSGLEISAKAAGMADAGAKTVMKVIDAAGDEKYYPSQALAKTMGIAGAGKDNYGDKGQGTYGKPGTNPKPTAAPATPAAHLTRPRKLPYFINLFRRMIP